MKKVLIISTLLCLVCAVSNAQLIGHWEFEDNLYDSSGGGHSGSQYGSIKYTDGIHGRALDLTDPAGNNAVIVNNSEDFANGLSQISVSLWFRAHYRGKDWCGIVCKGSESGQGWGVKINSYWDVGMLCLRGVSTANQSPGGKTVIVDNMNWHHVVGVYDGVNNKLYVDGKLDRIQATTGPIAPSEFPLIFGAKSKPGYPIYSFCKCALDDVRIYDHVLSEADITALYEGAPVAFNPVPSNKAAGIDPSIPDTLSWKSDKDLFDVYLTNDANDFNSEAGLTSALIGSAISEKTIEIPETFYPMPEFATYYWRVDERNASGVVTTGDVWEFTVGGEIAHLDASNVVLAGVKVSEWTDLSPRGNDAIMPTSSLQPKVVNNAVNGQPAISFTKDDEESETELYKRMIIEANPTDFNANHFTWFVVYKKHPEHSTGCLLFTKYQGYNKTPGVWGSDHGWGVDRVSTYGRCHYGNNRTALTGERSYVHEGSYGWNLVVGMTDKRHAVDGDVDSYLNPFTTSKPTLNDALIGGGYSSFGLCPLDGAQHMGTGVGCTLESSWTKDPVAPYDYCWKSDSSAFGGEIAEIIIYNRGMSQDEIAVIAQTLKDKYDYGEEPAPGEVLTIVPENVNVETLKSMAENWLVTY